VRLEKKNKKVDYVRVVITSLRADYQKQKWKEITAVSKKGGGERENKEKQNRNGRNGVAIEAPEKLASSSSTQLTCWCLALLHLPQRHHAIGKKPKKRRKRVPWIAAHLEDILCISHMGENFRLIIIINTNMNQTQIRTINKQDHSGACQSSNADDTQFLAAAQVRFGRPDRTPRFCLVIRELKRGRKCHRRTIMSSLYIMIEVFVMNSNIGGGGGWRGQEIQ